MAEQSTAAPGPPTPAGNDHRVADWYELFFDLVFVVVVALSAHLIEAEPSAGTVLIFALLLFPLWWAWVNLMITNNLYGARYPVVGALVIAAMPGPAAMAIAISGGVSSHGWLYAAGAAWIRVVLLVMWLIPHLKGITHTPLWRPFAYNLGTAAIWLVSIGLPPPYRYLVWGLAVAIEVFLLAFRSRFSFETYQRASVSHSLERVGLFVVIVIGEAVYLAVTALAEHPSLPGGAAGLFGFLACALLARAFFRGGLPHAEAGLAAAQRAKSYGAMRDVIMYLPFLLVTALTLIAAIIGIAVEHAEASLHLEVRLLLAAGVAGFYLANAIVGARLGRPVGRVALLLLPGIVLPAAACLIGDLPAWGTLGCVALALALLDAFANALSRSSNAATTLNP